MAGIRRATVVECWSWIGLFLLNTLGCGSSSTPPGEIPRFGAWFEDATAVSGLKFVHDAGPLPQPGGQYWMPQAIGSGAALFDFDNDGWLDIYLVQNGGRSPKSLNRLYRNTGGDSSDRRGEPGGSLRFTDVTASSGLGVAGQGMGVAAGDANNDGWVDVVVTEYGKLRLFTNQRDGTFRETTEESGLVSPLWGCSASFLDYDRDGWLDLVVANYVAYDPSRPCISAGGVEDFAAPKEFEGTVTKLFRNTTGLKIGDRGSRASPPVEPGEAGAAPPSSFADVTLAAGLGQTPGPGLGVLCADFSGDGWADIFIANDGQPNRLWINRRDGTFSEEAIPRGVAYNSQGVAEASMGVALADVDGQGGADLFVTHLTEERHTLWRRSDGPGGPAFTDRTASSRIAGAGSRGTGFGTVLADFDLDGDVDLAIVNGRVSRKSAGKAELTGAANRPTPALFWRPYAERNQLFENDDSGVFEDVSGRNSAPAPKLELGSEDKESEVEGKDSRSEASTPEGFCATADVSRGLACGDLDNDGDLDLVVTSVGAKARIFRNVAARKGHWLIVRAMDATNKRDAYGAEVTVVVGQRRWWRQINPSYSFLCGNDPRAHFGVGDVATIDRIEVLWPSGRSEEFPGGAVDRIVELRQREGGRAMRNCEMQSLATGLLPVAVFLACTAGCGTRPSTKPNGLLTEPPAIDTTTLDAPVREAIEAARAGVRAEPQSAAKWGELGKLLHAHEAAAETSIDCLAQAERRQPNWPEWPYLQGVWLARDDPDHAIAKLRRAVELGGDEELTARMRLAETLAAEEQFEAARREADYVLSRSPASARARLLIGRLSLSEGKLREAREALEKIQNDPIARPAAMAMLAQVQQRVGEAAPISQSSAGTGRVVGWPDKFVDDVTAMRRGRRAELAVADGLLARNRPAEALAAAKATIDRYPDFAWAWLLSGRAHLQLNEPQRAEKALRRSIELSPESVESHFYLGAALVGQGRTQDAAESFRRAAEITPDFAQAHYYLAECLTKLGVTEGALVSLRRAVAAKPDFVAAHVALARLLRMRGEVGEAREHVQAAIAVEPGNAEARKLLAELAARNVAE